MLIDLISAATRLDRERLLYIAANASKRYKIYTIPKRTGGERTIAHPARDLKALQRLIANSLLKKYPVHPSATAYKAGSSIKKNAEQHVGSRYTNRHDFKDFFPSLKRQLVANFLQLNPMAGRFVLDDKDINFITNIVCRYDQLTIGAPTSPILSNVLLFDFDTKLHEACLERGITYTRYADDIFFSSYAPNVLVDTEGLIKSTLKKSKLSTLRINPEKSAYLSKKGVRRVTGLVLTPSGSVSIGRDRKREIKALVFKHTAGDLSLEDLWRLRGLIAFSLDAEPEFVERLSRKYGNHVIEGLTGPQVGQDQ